MLTAGQTTTMVAVENPATGEVIGSVPNLSADEVAAAVARARAAQPAWAALGFERRAELLTRCRQWLIDNSDRVADSIVAENGKPYDEAFIEIAYVLTALEYWGRTAADLLADEPVQTGSIFVQGRTLLLRYTPVGVVGVIGPWNNPILNNFGDVIPALAAGNTALLKPSEIAPLTSLLMTEMTLASGSRPTSTRR
ncbi:MAG TPA: aldehyde dehydrogenase family protein [Actinokineospora sp.]|jgi:acyl-CoA reductase-like NAD-dependent aldehyde dehydrogenase|nr:aldehyde dehydrogenase family protein [Actinokineospora sp.]